MYLKSMAEQTMVIRNFGLKFSGKRVLKNSYSKINVPYHTIIQITF